MGTPLGSKYIPYTYMDPLGWAWGLVFRDGAVTSPPLIKQDCLQDVFAAP